MMFGLFVGYPIFWMMLWTLSIAWAVVALSIHLVACSFLANSVLMSVMMVSPNCLAAAEKAFSTKKRLRIQPTPSSTWLTHLRQRSGVVSGS